MLNNIILTTLIIFFVDFIPYIGVGTVFIPWILYQFFTEQFMLTIQLSILYIIVIIARQILEPKILASSIGIHPLIALIILFIGIQSFGILGVFHYSNRIYYHQFHLSHRNFKLFMELHKKWVTLIATISKNRFYLV